MGFNPFGGAGPLQLQATTGPGGYALVNATASVIAWTAPADGQYHRAQVFASMLVSSAETGGLIQVQWTGPGAGAAQFNQLFAANLAAGAAAVQGSSLLLVIAPGSTIRVQQSSALSVGAAVLNAEIWGS